MRFLLGTPGAIVGTSAALVGGISFTDADYWSNVVAVSYFVVVPAAGSSLPIEDRPASDLIRVTVGRALSRDWEGWYGAGRTVQKLEAQSEHSRLQYELIARLEGLSRSPAEPSPQPLGEGDPRTNG